MYPVVSRRAGGVSIGLNLNPNNACNFRCIYCQVPNLTWGKGPPIDLDLFERELTQMLEEVVRGDFMERRVPEGARRLNDLAFSGNGEPTSSPQFGECVAIAGRLMNDFGLLQAGLLRGDLRQDGQRQDGAHPAKLVLITNGTLTDRPGVAAALSEMKHFGGEIWFKLDSATREGTQQINQNAGDLTARAQRLAEAARRCPTWVQTCLFSLDGSPPSEHECSAYLSELAALKAQGTPLEGVLLYGLARPSMQPEAPRLSALDASWLEAFAEQIRALGLVVKVSV